MADKLIITFFLLVSFSLLLFYIFINNNLQLAAITYVSLEQRLQDLQQTDMLLEEAYLSRASLAHVEQVARNEGYVDAPVLFLQPSHSAILKE